MDIMSADKRSELMGRIRGRNTKPEQYLASLLRASGVKFRRHVRTLPGCPDFVFAQDQVAVFVDGDFWHGWRFPAWRMKLSARWGRKIEATRKRDTAARRRLRASGWTVVRIWEHQIETNALNCAQRVFDTLLVAVPDCAAAEKCFHEMPRLKRRDRLPKLHRKRKRRRSRNAT